MFEVRAAIFSYRKLAVGAFVRSLPVFTYFALSLAIAPAFVAWRFRVQLVETCARQR